MSVWPPLALNENALGYVYNCAYDAALEQGENGTVDAHQAACEAVHREGFHHATGGYPLHNALTELHAAAKDILLEFPESGDDEDISWLCLSAKKERLEKALNTFDVDLKGKHFTLTDYPRMDPAERVRLLDHQIQWLQQRRSAIVEGE